VDIKRFARLKKISIHFMTVTESDNEVNEERIKRSLVSESLGGEQPVS
jgi:hypothetical protein